MAVQTPIANSLYDTVAGNVRVELVKFASVSNNDTYVSGLSNIIGFSIDGGSSAPTLGITTSGSTVTFLVTSGPGVNVSVVLWGF